MIFEEDSLFKVLPAKTLVKLLNTLPKNSFVTVNRVGNLTIYFVPSNTFKGLENLKRSDLQYDGFIDFLLEGEIER